MVTRLPGYLAVPKPGFELGCEPDGALVRRAAAGEGAAFDVLVSRHRPALLRLCWRVAGDPMLAEDCAQDASLLALLRLHRLREPDQFGAWLRGIGLRVSRRAVARPFEAPVLDVEQEGSEFTGEADGSNWEDALTAAELSKQLRRAVDDLPHGQREAVRLFYLGGRTYQEAAAGLGIPVGALKVRLHKARAALRECLLLEEPLPSRPRWDDRTVAPHEAAHAVVHWQHGGMISCVSIAPAPITSVAEPLLPHRLTLPPRDLMQTIMAGEAATFLLRGSRAARLSGAGDRLAAQAIARYVTCGDEVEAALAVHAAWLAARELLEQPHTWSLVQRVAGALVTHRRLDGDDLRVLLSD